MSRREFIESHGATCLNWLWSWSFVNAANRFMIFGAWQDGTRAARTEILASRREFDAEGRRRNGYRQSRDHLRLVEEEGYTLFTFPMTRSPSR